MRLMSFQHTIIRAVLPVFALVLLTGPGAAQAPVQPEGATGYNPQESAKGTSFMVSTANPLATQVGYDILARGGTAADAGVAVQLVLGLVEPQSSGLGGGGFALYYDAKTKKLSTLDGRETAPSTAGKHLFRGNDGKPMKFHDAAVGGRSIGVPGTPALLHKLHEWYGKLPWRDLFSPAITLAETGFEVSPRLAALVTSERNRMSVSTDAKLYFFPDSSTPIYEGYKLVNPLYARTLRTLALDGVGAFYNGQIGERIVIAAREARKNPGLMSIEDMTAYAVKERAPVCGPYRGYKICSMGEPSSGGLTLLSALGMLEQFNLAAMGPQDPKAWHLIVEASRLAFADRNYFMADPDFVKTPGTALIDPAYLKNRAALISPDGPMKAAMPGTPPGWVEEPRFPDDTVKPPGTTHVSIVDSYGNVLSMTSSIEDAFGSRMMVEGFLLNNQLTDFAFEPDYQGKEVANRVQGGKRPRSSMTPVIMFDGAGQPVLVIGSAGGSAIIGYVLERIVALVDWKMGLQDALNMPNIVNRGAATEVETGAETLENQLKNFGHVVETSDLTSGLTAIEMKNGTLTGAADPRREGVARGQ